MNTTPLPRAVLGARHVQRSYGTGPAALTDVSADFHAGRLTAVMGPSGSGKSTLLHLLSGLDDADSGEIRLGETAIHDLDEDARAELRHQRMGFVFQGFNLLPGLTGLENIRLPLRLGRRPVTADPRWETYLIDLLDIADALDRSPTQLSGGQQQRIAIARALLHRPDVVFADEPTGSLDVATGRNVLALFSSLVRDHGICMVMVTHDPVAASTCDRILVLRDGAIEHDLPTTAPEELARLLIGHVAA